MNITGAAVTGRKSPSQSVPEAPSSAAAVTATAATGCLRLMTRVEQTRTTRSAASAESGASGRVVSSTRETSANVTASVRSNQLVATALLTENRSATAHDHRQMRSQHPARWDVGMTGEGPAVRRHPLASGRKSGRRSAAFDRESADLEVERRGEVAQLYGGRLALLAAYGHERVLHRAVGRQFHASR